MKQLGLIILVLTLFFSENGSGKHSYFMRKFCVHEEMLKGNNWKLFLNSCVLEQSRIFLYVSSEKLTVKMLNANR